VCESVLSIGGYIFQICKELLKSGTQPFTIIQKSFVKIQEKCQQVGKKKLKNSKEKRFYTTRLQKNLANFKKLLVLCG
jgi:hypothetical protein